MMFAQFYQLSTGYIAGTIPPRFSSDAREAIPATGDRSVIILDARVNSRTLGELAAAECKKRGFIAWRIYRGESFTRSAPVSQINYLHDVAPVKNPAWLSAHGM